MQYAMYAALHDITQIENTIKLMRLIGFPGSGVVIGVYSVLCIIYSKPHPCR